MPFSKSTRRRLLLGMALAILAVLVISFRKTLDPETFAMPQRETSAGSNTPQPSRQASGPRETDAESPAAPPPGMSARPSAEVSRLIQGAMEALAARPDPAKAREILRQLRNDINRLSEAGEDEAAAAILAFLESGEDAPTGLPFVVGPDGVMELVPSLRLALLDLLPSLDPLSALALARKLMDHPSTPDEYALALRNLAWNDLDGDLHPELESRFRDLLQMPWLDQPSAGLLESFDIAVEIGGSQMLDELLSVARQAAAKSNAAVSQAAFISLDRLVLRDPGLLVSAFADPRSMDFAPQQRASLLSRLDITQPAQRALFSRYLSEFPHATGELEYFSRLFPNANFLHGHRLVTADDPAPGIDQIVAADARVLAELDALSFTGEAAAAVSTIKRRLGN
jgi:hypothetical protein